MTAAVTAGGELLGILVMLAAVVFVVFLAVRWAMAPIAYMSEPTVGVGGAMPRSRELVEGAWWRTFGILLLTSLIVLVPMWILVPLGVGAVIESAAGVLILSTIGTAVVSTLAAPFFTGVMGLLYIDQRIRRERFDVELARSAGGPPHAG